jgi:hypothetical protein
LTYFFDSSALVKLYHPEFGSFVAQAFLPVFCKNRQRQ